MEKFELVVNVVLSRSINEEVVVEWENKRWKSIGE